MDWTLFALQLINGLTLGAIYAVIALGYTMVYGIIELINFAHGDVYTAGSFVALALLTLLGATRHMAAAGIAFALIVTFLATMLIMGTTGIVIERFAYRPLRGRQRLAPLLTAIGVSFSLENLLQLRAGLIAFTAAVLGGIGNTTGAALGGFVIGFVEVMTAQYIGFQWAEVTIFSVLILVLIFRPTGLLGQQLPERT